MDASVDVGTRLRCFACLRGLAWAKASASPRLAQLMRRDMIAMVAVVRVIRWTLLLHCMPHVFADLRQLRHGATLAAPVDDITQHGAVFRVFNSKMTTCMRARTACDRPSRITGLVRRWRLLPTETQSLVRQAASTPVRAVATKSARAVLPPGPPNLPLFCRYRRSPRNHRNGSRNGRFGASASG